MCCFAQNPIDVRGSSFPALKIIGLIKIKTFAQTPLQNRSIPFGWVGGLLVFVLGIVECATDIYLPSLPTLVSEFKTTEESIGLTISAYFLSFCLMGPIYGPLSDALGRRYILIAGIALFSVFSFFCAFATSVPQLIIYRVLQGMGASVAWVVGLAIVKDVYTGKDRINMLSLMGTMVAVSPGIAPILGGYITTLWGWRPVFWVVGIFSTLSVILLIWHLDETHPPAKRQKLQFKVAIHNYKRLLQTFQFYGYALISALMYSGIMIYVVISPFYYIEYLGISTEVFGCTQAALILAYMLGTYVNRRAIHHWKSRWLLGFGLLSALAGAIIFSIFTLLFPKFPALLTASMALYSFGAGVVFSNTSNYALEALPEAGGASAALLGVFEMTLVAFGVWLAGILYVHCLFPISLCILVCVLLSLFLLVRLEKKTKDPLSPMQAPN